MQRPAKKATTSISTMVIPAIKLAVMQETQQGENLAVSGQEVASEKGLNEASAQLKFKSFAMVRIQFHCIKALSMAQLPSNRVQQSRKAMLDLANAKSNE